MTTIKLGITGGIGSGKSVLSRLLETMGVPVYIADTEAKRLTANDWHIRTKLIELFGKQVFQEGELNKPFLASKIFNDKTQQLKVNNIIHPRVKEDFKKWVDRHSQHKIVGMESAILIESGFGDSVDKIMMVYAPLEVRLKRIMSRDGLTKEQIVSRINSQMDDEQKKEYADYIIYNEGTEALIPQVLRSCIIKHLP